MSDLARVVALSGALDENMFRELSRWRLPIEIPEGEPFASREDAVNAIEEALSTWDQVEFRTTDLDVLKQFLSTQRKGKLFLDTGKENGTFDVSFGKTKTGDYIIPWRADSLEETLTNGETHLLDGRKKVYFNAVRDLFFGEQKAFIICTPIREKQ